MSDKRMPDWLQPYKNEWLSMSSLQKIMQFEDRPFSSWFHEVKGRLRSIRRLGANGMVATQYLVKHVWACARAHGIAAMPTVHTVPVGKQLQAALERASKAEHALRGAEEDLGRAKANLATMTAARAQAFRTMGVKEARELVRLAFRATDARAVPGVYFLLGGDLELAYVGQSKNVLTRMVGHAEKEFEHVRMLPEADPQKRLELETRLIALLQPPLNISGIRREAA